MARSNFASGFAGFLLGVVTGLGIAAAAALLITKSPVPFVEKVQKVTADVDPAQKLAGSVDPNRRLNEQPDTAQNPVEGGIKTVEVAPSTGSAPAQPQSKPVSEAACWVQAGAFQTSAAAEERKAMLAMSALEAQVDKSGSLWRVRIGPFTDRKAASEIQTLLNDQGIKAAIMQQK